MATLDQNIDKVEQEVEKNMPCPALNLPEEIKGNLVYLMLSRFFCSSD